MRKSIFPSLLLSLVFYSTQAQLLQTARGQESYESISSPGTPTVLVPTSSLLPEQIGILVNDDDSISNNIALYYAQQRNIPLQNIIHLRLGNNESLSNASFEAAMTNINQALSGRENSIQAFVLCWLAPNKFEGASSPGGSAESSLCAAFAKGALLENTGWDPHQHFLSNALYQNFSSTPFSDYGIRPCMHLMTGNYTLASVKALIDLGVSADASEPDGDGYFVKTRDLHRNIRWPSMNHILPLYPDLNLQSIDLSNQTQDYLTQETGILFYFTGNDRVYGINSNTYVAGALCDHLTSSGGNIGNHSQTFVGEWMDAGVTASYGTVSEPQANQLKFPYIPKLVERYYMGGSVLDAYWSSVGDPSQAYFVGEPLARPYKTLVNFENDVLNIRTSIFERNTYYLLEEANSSTGPWTSISPPLFYEQHERSNIRINGATVNKFYRISRDYIPPSIPQNLSTQFFSDYLLLPCSLRVDYCEVSCTPSTDNTGEIASYRLYIDGVLFDTKPNSSPVFKIRYDPEISQKQANRLSISAVDKNGNESAPSTVLLANLPAHKALACMGSHKKKKTGRETFQNQAVLILEQNTPNPFKEKTTICFSLRKAGMIKFSIFRVDGQLLYQRDIPSTAGKNVIEWDGRDFLGEPLPKGLYLYQVKQGKHSQSKKMLVQ